MFILSIVNAIKVKKYMFPFVWATQVLYLYLPLRRDSVAVVGMRTRSVVSAFVFIIRTWCSACVLQYSDCGAVECL